MNAITLLKDDHRRVKALFRQFDRTPVSQPRRRKQLVGEFTKELVIHSSIEEQVFYPKARERAQKAGDVVLESLEEHHVVDWTLSELEKMEPSDERYNAKVKVLMEMVKHHMEEEEGELFPKVAGVLDRKELNDLGAELDRARRVAPRRVDPMAPDTPTRKGGGRKK